MDEAVWEEMETGLRHNGRLTPNYLFLMALGGVISAVGYLSDLHHQIVAFVAAAIIAPGLESLAKIPFGLTLRRYDVAWVGLKASTVGYLILAVAGGLTFWLLLMAGEVSRETFLNQKSLDSLLHPKPKDFLVSLSAAAASILMYLSYRRNVIAGPLVALVLIHAAAALGMTAVIGEWHTLALIAKRLAIDVMMVIGMGLLLIFAKQKWIHKRQPLR